MNDEELIEFIREHFNAEKIEIENMGLNNDKTCNMLIIVRKVHKYKDIKDKEEEEYLNKLREKGEL